MVDVHVALGQLKRRGGARRTSVDEKPLTGRELVNAFRQINPARVKAVAP
jgi:hypothetical protein